MTLMLIFHISLFIRRIHVLTEPNQPNTAVATEKKITQGTLDFCYWYSVTLSVLNSKPIRNCSFTSVARIVYAPTYGIRVHLQVPYSLSTIIDLISWDVILRKIIHLSTGKTGGVYVLITNHIYMLSQSENCTRKIKQHSPRLHGWIVPDSPVEMITTLCILLWLITCLFC